MLMDTNNDSVPDKFSHDIRDIPPSNTVSTMVEGKKCDIARTGNTQTNTISHATDSGTFVTDSQTTSPITNAISARMTINNEPVNIFKEVGGIGAIMSFKPGGEIVYETPQAAPAMPEKGEAKQDLTWLWVVLLGGFAALALGYLLGKPKSAGWLSPQPPPPPPPPPPTHTCINGHTWVGPMLTSRDCPTCKERCITHAH